MAAFVFAAVVFVAVFVLAAAADFLVAADLAGAPARAGEIDIVALKGRTLIAAEVKSFPAGALTASEALSHAKRRKLVSLIKQYARSHGYVDYSLRVDLITVEWNADGKPGRIEHLQSVATEDA